MAKPDTIIPLDFLRQCFAYYPHTGELIWRRRPPEHFSSSFACEMSNAQFAGMPAGKLDDEGYRCVSLKYAGKRRYLITSRVCWALAKGGWPAKDLDHETGD